MAKLLNIEKLTNNKFLNLHKAKFHNEKTNKDFDYFIATRRTEEEMACKTKDHNKCDAVMVLPVTREQEIILIKQYRPAINDYIYEVPAGLVDENETLVEAATRELFEEIGAKVLKMELVARPGYTSVGMSDETCAAFIAAIDGDNLNTSNCEENEDIEIIRLHINDIEDFINNNNVAIKTSLMLTVLHMSYQLINN